jgi:hypothetical protein
MDGCPSSQLLLYQSHTCDIKLDAMKKFGISEFQQKKPTFHDNSTCKEFLQVRVDSASSAEAREFTSNEIIYLIHDGKLYFTL